MDQSAILQTVGLTKKYGDKVAINGISLTVEPGEIYALIGPNGSGKTTFINSVVGLLRPDSGKISIGGLDTERNSLATKSFFGYVSDNPQNYLFLTGIEFLRLTANLRGINMKEANQKISSLSTIFRLEEILKARMESYSRGNLQKTAFLSAILSDPKILIIDEPIVGLDPDSVRIFGDKLRDFASRGKSVFFSTHSLDFAEKYADKVGILNNGLLVHETTALGHLESIYLKYTHTEK